MSLEDFDEEDQFRIPAWADRAPAAPPAPAPLADAWEPEVGEEWKPMPEVPLGDAGGAPTAAPVGPPPSAAVAPPATNAASVSEPPNTAEVIVPEVPPSPAATTPALGYGHEEKSIESTIKAHGSGEVIVPPDCVRIDLGVDVQGATMEEARNAAAEATHAFLGALKKLDIPAQLALKTHQVGIHPVHEGRNRAMPFLREEMPKILGYRARSGVTARLKGLPVDELAAQASKIVDTASKNGANDVGGVVFGLDRPEVAARQALKLAVADARADAEALADASGVKLTTLHSLCDQSGPGDDLGTGIMAMSAGIAPRAKSASTPIEAGDITVRRSVTGRWYFRSGI